MISRVFAALALACPCISCASFEHFARLWRNRHGVLAVPGFRPECGGSQPDRGTSLRAGLFQHRYALDLRERGCERVADRQSQ